jgi:hypothetical protein
VTTVIPQTYGVACPTNYTGGTLCYATNQYLCRYSGETYTIAGSSTGMNACPAGTTEHGYYGCSTAWFQLFCVAN